MKLIRKVLATVCAIALLINANAQTNNSKQINDAKMHLENMKSQAIAASDLLRTVSTSEASTVSKQLQPIITHLENAVSYSEKSKTAVAFLASSTNEISKEAFADVNELNNTIQQALRKANEVLQSESKEEVDRKILKVAKVLEEMMQVFNTAQKYLSSITSQEAKN